MKRYFIILFILFPLLTCDKLSELETINTQMILVGRVTDKYSKEGIADATVRIRSGTGFITTTTSEDNAKTTDINESGYFVLEDVIARGANLTLTISKSDYQNYIDFQSY